ncbi:spermidine/spermine N(1)-acetyltransferase [Nibrella saemangeumensis]|uniref:Spermidine/spermine N(1)-acetyltransferase n=1 Tax=Nibrella saemangeumensis TaxID=1084526 RepID=A0ABP8NPK8_9BACT
MTSEPDLPEQAITSAKVIELKPVTADAAPQVARVAVRAYNDHYTHLWFDGGSWYVGKCFTPEVLREDMSHPNHRYYLILAAQQPVGFVKLKLHEPLPGHEGLNALELERIYIERAATGQGVGKAVMQQIIDIARQHQKSLIWLKAMDSSTEAIAFYRQNGFVHCGTHHLDFPVMKPEYRGMVIMKKEL